MRKYKRRLPATKRTLPTKWASTEDFIRQFSQLNNLKPSWFIIGNRRFLG